MMTLRVLVPIAASVVNRRERERRLRMVVFFIVLL